MLMDSVNKYGSDGIPFTGQIAEIKPAEQQLLEITQQIQENIQQIVDNLLPIIQSMVETAVQGFSEIFDELSDLIYPTWIKALMVYPNKRVVHCALYHKKERVRKKNINRILKYYEKAVTDCGRKADVHTKNHRQ